MDQAKTTQETKSLPYEAPRLVASLDALDLLADADGQAVGKVCTSTVPCG